MNNLAKANAKRLIEKYYFNSQKELNDNFESLIVAEGLIIIEEELNDYEGRILFDEENGVITINKNSEERQKRFTIAHEMGHFYNESGKGNFKCGFNELYNYNKNIREINANEFASELLMHEKWFKELSDKKKITKELFSEISEEFNVSISAAVIRYSTIGYYPIATVMSTNGIVKWVSINKDFSYKYIRINRKVSELSYTSDFFEGKEIPEIEDIPARAWFNEDYNLRDKDKRIYEMNMRFPQIVDT